MPAKWQQWMPFKIDAFKASPAVQAMHPAARAGYLYLLSCCWQSEDCTIPGDDMELAELSGLGDELWAVHRERILRKFGRGPDNRLMNHVLRQEWDEAKRVFESRQASAMRTNTERWSIGDRSVTDKGANRSADTRTGTVTNTENTNTLPAKRGTRLPEGYQPTQEHKDLSKELGIDLRAEFPKFRDYWAAIPGTKGVKLDWDATLRNWIRNAAEKMRSTKPVPPKTVYA